MSIFAHINLIHYMYQSISILFLISIDAYRLQATEHRSLNKHCTLMKFILDLQSL